MSKIKHIPTEEIHEMKDSKTTKCGFDITENPKCWEVVNDLEKTTCDKNGCK